MLIIYLEWLFIIHYLFKDSSIIYLNYLQDCGDVDLIFENPEKYKQYFDEIEMKRKFMYEKAIDLGFTHPQVVSCSQELDKLLNKYLA